MNNILRSVVVRGVKNVKDIMVCAQLASLQSTSCVADVNECSKDSSPCKEDEYCLNTEGSYSCKGKRRGRMPYCICVNLSPFYFIFSAQQFGL